MRAAFEALIPGSKSPTVGIFNDFSKAWKTLNQLNYESEIEEKYVCKIVKDKKDTIIEFVKAKLKNHCLGMTTMSF